MSDIDVIEIKITENKIVIIRIPRGTEDDIFVGFEQSYTLSEYMMLIINNEKFNKSLPQNKCFESLPNGIFNNDYSDSLKVYSIEITNKEIIIVRMPERKNNEFLITGVKEIYPLSEKVKVNISKNLKQCQKCGNYFVNLNTQEICDTCFDKLEFN